MHLSFHVHIIQVLTSIYYIDVPGTGVKQRDITTRYYIMLQARTWYQVRRNKKRKVVVGATLCLG